MNERHFEHSRWSEHWVPSLRRFLFAALYGTGIPFVLRHVIQRRAVTILCYHDPAPEVLAEHLRVLSRRYNFISLRDYIDWRSGKSTRPLPTYPLVVTMDDGHCGNVLLHDVLQQERLPVTIFVCSAIVGSGRRFWFTALPPKERQRLKCAPDEERRSLLAKRGFCETRDEVPQQALSQGDMHRLEPLVDFQSHSRFHPILPRCDDARADDEIRGSKTELEQRFDLSIYAFAYPNGDYSVRETELVRAAGYTCAVTIDGGYNTRTTYPFQLHRMAVPDVAGRCELLVKASGLWRLWERSAGRRPRYATRPDAGGRTSECRPRARWTRGRLQ